MTWMRRCAALALLACAGWAQAHRPSDAYLTLHLDGSSVGGRWEIALRDLDLLVPLDRDGDRALTWGELRAARPELDTALHRALSLTSGPDACPLRIVGMKLNDRLDGRFAWFELTGSCPSEPTSLGVAYRLLSDLDPAHRGVLVLTARAATHTAVLGPAGPHEIDLRVPSSSNAFAQYLVEGVRHIWIGYDHVLFLLALLIPAVLVRIRSRWKPEAQLASALWKVAGTVTAFTVAHSVTLALAALDVVRLPTSLVESAIALSVLLAAANNVWPVVDRGRWAMAFGFGLIHGFGFASVFGELGLPRDLRLIGLLAFNLGVEVGQLSIVLIVVPALFAMRRTAFYQSGIRVWGSAGVAILAAYWLIERSGLWPA